MDKKYSESVAVIGIGRVGLPLAIFLSDLEYMVYGIGRNEEKISELLRGKMPFIEKGATQILRKNIKKSLTFTTDYSVVSNCNYIMLTLGTPVDENMNPILDQINQALTSAMEYFKPNQTLILRSTVSPRTTQFVKSLIEEKTDLKVGKNFYLAFCPERIAEGNSIAEMQEIPQIIGGIDRKSAKKAETIFKRMKVQTILTDDVSAELAKLFTNMYRYINFAIANEFMLLAQNYHRDIYEIVNLVNYKYKRGGLTVPGLTGGPCLFKDGFFLVSDVPYIDLITTSWKINESIPLLLVKLIRERMKLDGKKAVLLGLAFKSEIDDIRESLSFKVRKALMRERAKITLHDPFVKHYANQEIVSNVYESLKDADLIFIATNHKEYRKLNINKIKRIVKKDCMVCDIWNVLGKNKIIYRINSD